MELNTSNVIAVAKIVIWDLDETFWKGTLSEEGIVPVRIHIELLKTLTSRGIVNSIASKNDFNAAKEKLEQLEIWDYFIFPHIDWSPKGQMVEAILSKAGLRAENAVFIDDNRTNLEEVRFVNPGIAVKEPVFISKIFSHPAFLGKDDSSHTRLKYYKILEAKVGESKKYSDNEVFLQQSSICVERCQANENSIDRVLELIGRTNQLNYTKNRIDRKSLERLISDDNYICEIIRVNDRYGNYGVVGFYALHRQDRNLEHFLFSCRILNLGVEQYVYSQLDYPNVEVVGDVATELTHDAKPAWIKNGDFSMSSATSDRGRLFKVFLKGGCDLSQMVHYSTFESKLPLSIFSEFNYPSPVTDVQVHNEHSMHLLQCLDLSRDARRIFQDDLPFIDDGFYESSIYSNEHDVVVLSVLMDYTQEIYRNKLNGECVAFGGYANLIELGFYKFKEICVNDVYDRKFYDYFCENYEHIGQISASKFSNNLERLRCSFSAPIIFINGAEVDSPHPRESKAKERHRLMNETLDLFVAKHADCYLLDVRPFVFDGQLTNNIRHYKRDVYVSMAQSLSIILSDVLGVKVTGKGRSVGLLRCHSFLSNLRSIAGKYKAKIIGKMV